MQVYQSGDVFSKPGKRVTIVSMDDNEKTCVLLHETPRKHYKKTIKIQSLSDYVGRYGYFHTREGKRVPHPKAIQRIEVDIFRNNFREIQHYNGIQTIIEPMETIQEAMDRIEENLSHRYTLHSYDLKNHKLVFIERSWFQKLLYFIFGS